MNKLRTLFEQGQFELVVKHLHAPEGMDEFQLKAWALQKMGQFEQAMMLWNVLIKNDPQNAQHYSERAVCKFQLRFPHAIDDLDKALALEPNSSYYHACRAYIKDKLGDTEGAVEDYRTAHELDPDDAITLNNLGLAEQKLGYTAKARASFRKSNDLLGIKTADAEEFKTPERPNKVKFKAQWQEVRKMLSSVEEFKRYLKELFSKE